jgi:hypothetical protein
MFFVYHFHWSYRDIYAMDADDLTYWISMSESIAKQLGR